VRHRVALPVDIVQRTQLQSRMVPRLLKSVGGRVEKQKSGNCLEKALGAQGRNRTTDTAIFSRMLYQLSYLGIPLGPEGPSGRRFIVGGSGPVYHASPSVLRGAASPRHPARRSCREAG